MLIPNPASKGAAMPQPASRTFKLGKHPAKFDDRTLQFGKYLTQALPPPPASKDWSKKVKKWPMMGNDQYGDCTCAAAGHLIEEWTANAGKTVIVPDAAIISFYNHFANGVADAGANMLDVLKYWRGTGLAAHTITAFAQLEPRNHSQAMDAVNLFGGCYIGVALPDFAVAPGSNFLATPWVVPASGPTGKAAPNPQNGHCIPAVAYDQRNLYVVTWGALKSMSWQFYDAYAEEAFAVLSPDFFNKKTKKTPAGFDLKSLQADLKAI
jgi:hypothetical protein